jgi:4-amino-4-deoxy-L-arabinose transferase-like glycosyltransferase
LSDQNPLLPGRRKYQLPREVWLVIGAGALIRFALLFISRDALISYRLPDDALYYFAIAKHIVLGHGVSFDGVHLTNGFHPLWLLSILPIFALRLSEWSSIYGVLLFQTILDCAVMWLIAVMFIRAKNVLEYPGGKWIVLIVTAAYALNPSIIIRSINGLETTLAALVLTLWLPCYYTVFREKLTWRIALWFGVLSGLLFLARTDFAIILSVSGLFLLLIKLRQPHEQWVKLVSAVGIAILIVTPWLIWNFYNFGTIEQVSGEAVPFMAQRKFDALYSGSLKYKMLAIEAARNLLKPFMYVGLGLPLVMLLLPLGTPKFRSKYYAGLSKSGILIPLLGALLLLLFHSIFRGFVRDWYILQLLPIIVVLFGVSCALFGRYDLRLFGLTLVLCYLAVGRYEWMNPRYVSQLAVVHAGVPYVEGAKPGTRFGSLNSGWYGFFAPQGVYVGNLDGVVNPDIFPFIKSGNMHGYLAKDSIGYVLDFKGDLGGYRGLIDTNLTKGFALDSLLGTPQSRDSLELLGRIAVSNGVAH